MGAPLPTSSIGQSLPEVMDHEQGSTIYLGATTSNYPKYLGISCVIQITA
jgi:hypothetical protein